MLPIHLQHFHIIRIHLFGFLLILLWNIKELFLRHVAIHANLSKFVYKITEHVMSFILTVDISIKKKKKKIKIFSIVLDPLFLKMK